MVLQLLGEQLASGDSKGSNKDLLPIILAVRGNLSSHIQKFEFQTSGESIESEAISQIIDRRFSLL